MVGADDSTELWRHPQNIHCILGSGCCSVGRAVAPETRDPRFESSNRQILFEIKYVEKTYIIYVPSCRH